jgi:hypothetical protein
MTYRPNDFEPPKSNLHGVVNTLLIITACVLILYWLTHGGLSWD